MKNKARNSKKIPAILVPKDYEKPIKERFELIEKSLVKYVKRMYPVLKTLSKSNLNKTALRALRTHIITNGRL